MAISCLCAIWLDTAGRVMHSEEVLRTDRIAGLRVAPDGERYILDVASSTPDGLGLVASVREYSTSDGRELRRIEIDGRPALLACAMGRTDLAITVASKDGTTEIWRLGRAPRDYELIGRWPLDVRAIRAAGDDVIIIETAMHPQARDVTEDAEIHAQRRTEATLHGGDFIRFWDRRIGPRTTRLVAFRRGLPPRVMTPGSDGVLLEATSWDLTPDGTTVVAVRRAPSAPTRSSVVVLYDTQGDTPPRVVGRPDAWYEAVRVSPDGARVIALSRVVDPDGAIAHPRPTLISLDDGAEEIVTTADTWPSTVVWGESSDTIAWVGPRDGFEPLVIAADDGAVRLTTSGVSVADPQWAAGRWWALQSSFFSWPHAVRLDGNSWLPLGSPPAHVTGVTVSRRHYRSDDGVVLPSWLFLPAPEVEGPVPLIVLAVAYCPSAWTDRWFYRWNPTAWAERGYAVLMPDVRPTLAHGLSTVEQGWGRWHETALQDLIAATDDAAMHPRIDGRRVGLKGGGWGAWLANWAASTTDRFRAVVAQGGAWDLESYQAVTDQADRWEDQLGDPVQHEDRYRALSPSRQLVRAGPATLIVTGERDYRAPVSDAIQAARALRRAGTEVELLVFDDEGHRIGRVASERLWYDVVSRWFATHLRSEPWSPPAGYSTTPQRR